MQAQAPFNRSRKKIAVIFALGSNVVLALSTLLMIVIFQFSLKKQAQTVLEQGYQTIVQSFEQGQLQEKTVAYRVDVQDQNLAMTLDHQTEATQDSKEKKEAALFEAQPQPQPQEQPQHDSGQINQSQPLPVAEPQGSMPETEPEADLSQQLDPSSDSVDQDQTAKHQPIAMNNQSWWQRSFKFGQKQMSPMLKEDSLDLLQPQFFTRIILPSGQIAFTSDVFQNINVDDQIRGLKMIQNQDLCLYTYSGQIEEGDKEGAIVQVAQYCALNQREKLRIVMAMVAIGAVVSVLSYLVGYKVSAFILKPLTAYVQQVKEFAQNVYHELLTPITVALTSVAASLKSGQHEQGLKAVKDDLDNVYQSLNLLSTQAFYDQAQINMVKVDLVPLVKAARSQICQKFGCDSSRVVLKSDDRTYLRKVNPVSFKLIIRNLLSNALKYSPQDSKIQLILSRAKLVVRNRIDEKNDINLDSFFKRYYRGKNGQKLKVDGRGLGLSIVKELCQIHQWQVLARVIEEHGHNYVEMEIQF